MPRGPLLPVTTETQQGASTPPERPQAQWERERRARLQYVADAFNRSQAAHSDAVVNHPTPARRSMVPPTEEEDELASSNSGTPNSEEGTPESQASIMERADDLEYYHELFEGWDPGEDGQADEESQAPTQGQPQALAPQDADAPAPAAGPSPTSDAHRKYDSATTTEDRRRDQLKSAPDIKESRVAICDEGRTGSDTPTSEAASHQYKDTELARSSREPPATASGTLRVEELKTAEDVERFIHARGIYTAVQQGEATFEDVEVLRNLLLKKISDSQASSQCSASGQTASKGCS